MRVVIDEVPGKVVACFRASRAIQSIADDRAAAYSRYLWNELSGQEAYRIDQNKDADIFMMLDDEETEDLVFLYLQSEGWYVVPHSRKGDTMTFEYLCVDPKTGDVAGTQVKTGKAELNKCDYAQFGRTVFLFQANDLYTGTSADHVKTIPREHLIAFMRKAVSWLPKTFRRKMEIVKMIVPEGC